MSAALAQLHIVRDPECASAFLQPARLQLLELLAEPNTSAGLARSLNLPRQQVNYHLRELERLGLAEFVEERKKGNCVERVVRATARSYLVSPEALGRLGATPADRRDRFSVAFLVQAAARLIREVATLAAAAKKSGKRIATFTLETEIRFKDAQDRHAFADELTAKVAELAARYHDGAAPGGRVFRLVAGVHPAITKPPEADGSSTDPVIVD